MRQRRRAQAGFTLIELMVSLVLFSFAIAGVLAVAVSMAQGFREQRKVIETETSARGALDYIADGLRMASPAVTTAVVKSQSGGNLVIDVSATTTIEDAMGPVGACPQGSVRVNNNSGLNGSDILEVVMASGPVVTTMTSTWNNTSTSIDVTDTSYLAVGDNILITDGVDGRIVRIQAITSATHVDLEPYSCTVTNPSVTPYPAGSMVLRVMRAKFYLAANVADAIPTALYMDPDSDGAMPPEPLADFIEDLQVAVGIDESGDKTIATDEWAYSGVVGTPSPFTNGKTLHAIRITLVARAATPLGGAAATFTAPTVEDHNPSGPADAFRRRMLSTSVEIRNLGDSP